MKCLAIGCSPRKNGNTSILVEHALKGAAEAGAEIDLVFLKDMRFSSCIACGGCNKEGICVQKDDMQLLYDKIIAADRIIFSAPIFSMGMNALGKAMVDRTQRFWATKYLLHKNVVPDKEKRPPREGIFISVAGTHLKNVFAGAEQVARYFFKMSEVELINFLLYTDVDEKGAVLNRLEILNEVYLAGKNLILDENSY